MGEKKIHKLKLQKSILFQVAGIVSNERIFILSNEIKRLSKINLEHHLLTVESKVGEVVNSFNAYCSGPDEKNIIYSLVSNRCTNGVLVDSFKKLDFFFIVSSESPVEIGKEVIKKIKGIEMVLAVSILELSILKQKNQFEDIVNQLRNI